MISRKRSKIETVTTEDYQEIMYGLSMAQIPVTLSELEGHFCCYDWQNASRGPSASAELLVLYRTIPNPHDVT